MQWRRNQIESMGLHSYTHQKSWQAKTNMNMVMSKFAKQSVGAKLPLAPSPLPRFQRLCTDKPQVGFPNIPETACRTAYTLLRYGTSCIWTQSLAGIYLEPWVMAIKVRRSNFWNKYSFCESETEIKSRLVQLFWPRSLFHDSKVIRREIFVMKISLHMILLLLNKLGIVWIVSK